MNKSLHGDCLELMQDVPSESVDMILCDLPYGLTKNKWDALIPFDLLWSNYRRIIKNNGAIALFGQDKFSAKTMLSNEQWHRYNLIWKKGERCSGFLNAKKMPLRNHEDIMIFYEKLPTYNPQMTKGRRANSRGKGGDVTNNNYGKMIGGSGLSPNGDMKYPKSILNFNKPHPPIHPTEKPVKLFQYLIETYTNKGDLVLDNCAGSFTTAIACLETKRNYICIEKERKYFDNGVARIQKWHEANRQIKMELI